VGRVVAPPGEVQAGIVVAIIGAPVLIALVLQPRRSML
jgi:iron complex transport system permease protein